MKIESCVFYGNIVHLSFPSQKEMASTLLRFEEYSESPKFKGRIFTLGMYREWYKKQYGGWTYYTDWRGFNIPCESFVPFLNGLFDPMSREEVKVLKTLVQLVKRAGLNSRKFCVIGTCPEHFDDAFSHEFLHALYYLNPTYKKEVNKILKTCNLENIFKALKLTGYNKSAWMDESQAYIATGFGETMINNGASISDEDKNRLLEFVSPYLDKIHI